MNLLKFDSETESEFGDYPRNEHKPDEEQFDNTEHIEDDDIEAATFSNDDAKPPVKGFKKRCHIWCYWTYSLWFSSSYGDA